MASLTRRRFLIAGTALGGGLLLGWYGWPRHDPLGDPGLLPLDEGEAALNGWLKIAPDGTVTVAVPRSEMGQGVYTALPMLVAEELDSPWEAVRVMQAPVDRVYANVTILVDALPFGPDEQGVVPAMARWTARRLGHALGVQVTGGSTSVRDAWEPMRRAGATARAMLVQAAARDWGVDPGECRTEAGRVSHAGSGRRAGYGELATAAARLEPPTAVSLKDPSRHTLIGRSPPRLDVPAKVDGSARFGADVRPPGLLFAALRNCPVFGGALRAVDSAGVAGRPGVAAVVELPAAVAVVADSWWRARTAVEALAIDWDDGPFAAFDDAALWRGYRTDMDTGEARVYRQDGDPEPILAQAASVLEAEYRVPFLAHACMEPMNCTARVDGDSCEVWCPSQAPTLVRWLAAAAAGLDAERVTVHTPLLGGGFGRRAETDLVTQAVTIAKAVPGRPVQLLWTREEDIRHDTYRPAVLCRCRAALDDRGRPAAWLHRSVGPSVSRSFTTRLLPWAALDLPDKTNVEGAANLPYAVPHLRVEHVQSPTPVPVGFWRSVGHSYNAFFTECFMDELAAAAGQDPLAYRLALLADRPRHRRVLERVAALAGWGTPPPPGHGRGVALHESFGSIVAQVAEVTLDEAGRVRVPRVACAIDCGPVVNPSIVEAQLQGGIVFGLSAALFGEITLERGRVMQGNFPDYPVLGLADTPAIRVEISAGHATLGGVGESGVPPIAPAVANGLYGLTGRRVRALPLGRVAGP